MATATARSKKPIKKPVNAKKMTYCWGASKTEGNATHKELLGGKGDDFLGGGDGDDLCDGGKGKDRSNGLCVILVNVP